MELTLFQLVVGVGLACLYARLYVPWAAAPAGGRVGRVRLSLLGRLRLHFRPVSAVMALAGIGWLLGQVSLNLLGMTALAIVVLLLIPVRYVLTTDGITLGHTLARRWIEFGGVTRRAGGVRLQGVAGAHSMTVWLSGRPDDDDVVLLLRQLVRGSYQGHFGASPVLATGVPLLGLAVDQVQVAGS